MHPGLEPEISSGAADHTEGSQLVLVAPEAHETASWLTEIVIGRWRDRELGKLWSARKGGSRGASAEMEREEGERSKESTLGGNYSWSGVNSNRESDCTYHVKTRGVRTNTKAVAKVREQQEPEEADGARERRKVPSTRSGLRLGAIRRGGIQCGSHTERESCEIETTAAACKQHGYPRTVRSRSRIGAVALEELHVQVRNASRGGSGRAKGRRARVQQQCACGRRGRITQGSDERRIEYVQRVESIVGYMYKEHGGDIDRQVPAPTLDVGWELAAAAWVGRAGEKEEA
ncbi:hypothetical protein B0H13DRAFT_1911527 [Mycena leptocephala]|nr:hypothetical protein B0H13DRAFT_1911527 [Mycena leptocephala]